MDSPWLPEGSVSEADGVPKKPATWTPQNALSSPSNSR